MTRLDVTIACGRLEQASARAFVLGVFRHVDPEGPAIPVDDALDGALRLLVTRRAFSAEAGTLFLLPAARSPLRTDFVALAGLGDIDRFGPALLEMVAANLARTLQASTIDDFATVLMGARSGLSARECTERLITGVAAGCRSRDGAQLVRMTICEAHRGRSRIVAQAARRTAIALSGRGLSVAVRSTSLSPGVWAPTRAFHGPPQVYLLVRQRDRQEGRIDLSSALLTAGPHAALATGSARVSESMLHLAAARVESAALSRREIQRLGSRLADALMPEPVRRQLATLRGHHVVVVHDESTAHVPWETLRFGSWTPALDAGLSRRYLASRLAVARWAEPPRRTMSLRLLLVENPTNDLQEAASEAARIRTLARHCPSLRLVTLRGRAATVAAVLRAIASERFDVLHFAGHAEGPDGVRPAGLRCADGVLSADRLSALRALPALVFINACDSARLADVSSRAGSLEGGASRARARSAGIAEAMLRAGVANYVGTHGPIVDGSARRFGTTFYRLLLAGEPLAAALVGARRAVQSLPARDVTAWADFVHYGNPDFRLLRSH
ncbi:MAG: CHAT domain-containing protein [Acidobacteriota bacterium]